MATLDTARAAKAALVQRFSADDRVQGIGLGGTKDNYVVTVHVNTDPEDLDLPEVFQGVRVEVIFTGEVRLQA